ncbi:hypothetical protein HPP92_023540 [Vanilla planifolia]|uniref:Uncharacterized protein n=1 Tax=Vanilla planifolia TaxID=51239 RepID=A0A835PT05_VANPL|nr:hypothetical protein HPP92_023540 [Vanilla planifolia]
MESSQRLKAVTTVVQEDERLNGKHVAAASTGEETVVDVSAKSWDVSLFEKPPSTSAQELYVYHNTFHLIPRSIRRLQRLKTLKFFANEIEILPQETVDLAELESLQVKVSLPGISGISLQKLKSLRELELHRVPPKLKAFSIFSDVSGLKCLTKLSICHFSIRYLPPEIGCLKRLEELDLSFNKLKNLPDALAELVVLKSLRVANNKLVDLPPGISCMRCLESLDLSNNRLTSLAAINLTSMEALCYLNLQYNRLPYDCQIPPWIDCNLEGNEGASSHESESLVKEGLHELHSHRINTHWSCKGCPSLSSTSDPPPSSRCIMNQRMKKGWKKQGDFQQIARQECLNFSRKSRVSEHAEDMPVNMGEEIHSSLSFVSEDSTSDVQLDVDEINLPDRSALSKASSKLIKDTVSRCKCIVSRRNSVIAQYGHADDEKTTRFDRADISEKGVYSCNADSIQSNKNHDYGNETEDGHHPLCSSDVLNVDDGCSSVGAPNVAFKSKRHFDGDLDNPKPSKFRRPIVDCSYLARKYSMESFCSTDDHIPDGFYDAGRDRQFMSLDDYEQSVCVGSREVILVDRGKDEELDAIALSAHLFLSRFQRSNLSSMEEVFDDFLRASILALYVSDCFGGSDRSTSVLRSRRSVVGSTKLQPFICTCSAGCTNDSQVSSQSYISELNLNKLCDSSMQAIKETNSSNIVPLGNLRFGVCRHRAVLMKYLCDRAEPRIPCELVRGYLDFMPHRGM